MLNRSADSEREIQLGRDSLSRRPDLAVHWQPAGIADGTRRCQITSQRIGQLLGDLDVFLLFDPAAHCHNDLGLCEIHGLLGLLENFLWLVADGTVGDLNAHRLNRRRAGSSFSLVAAKRAILEGRKPWSITSEAHVGRQLALKHLPREKE